MLHADEDAAKARASVRGMLRCVPLDCLGHEAGHHCYADRRRKRRCGRRAGRQDVVGLLQPHLESLAKSFRLDLAEQGILNVHSG